MPKNNEIEQLVNGSVADANIVNQIILNAGNEDGSIPYSEDTHQRDSLGQESLGSTAYPWGNININQDGYLNEIETTSPSVAASVQIKNLRKFTSLKDVDESTLTGKGDLFVKVNTAGTHLVFGTSSVVEFFSASDSWVAPEGVTKVYLTMVGGGGGGGGAVDNGEGGGGGGGGYVIDFPYTVTPGNSYNFVVGAAGAAGADGGGNGGNGGATSFNATVSCPGGSGGSGAASSSVPGAGGAGGGIGLNASGHTAGSYVRSGGNGAAGVDSPEYSGAGGATPFANGGAGVYRAASQAGSLGGSGGGGGQNSGGVIVGGAGGAGFILIKY